ncbi:hypothetical protein DPMN_053134 [Dreissena polymorpha]|uniref:Uncharacterized protein n=1 Tax=Dreissena polymorpha TaxID=45954 RepID=A0A9D4CN11_DREPO|nr:hypothetical protein DPMN_053134 [Dreissena polymorpha]
MIAFCLNCRGPLSACNPRGHFVGIRRACWEAGPRSTSLVLSGYSLITAWMVSPYCALVAYGGMVRVFPPPFVDSS